MGSLGPFFKTFLILSALMLASASFTFAGPQIAKGVTHYVDGQLSSNCTSANYSIANRNCTGSDGNAYGTANGLVNASIASAAGDTIIIRSFAGVYTGFSPRSGSSLNNRTTYHGYQNELPIVRGFGQDCNATCQPAQYVLVKNLIVDGGNAFQQSCIGDQLFLRYENLEIRNCGQHGMLGIGYSELIDLNVHSNGYNNAGGDGGAGHGLYTASGTSYINNLIDGGRYHHNSGYGIHCYSSCRNTIIRNLRADHNRGAGVIVAFDSGVEVYNVVADNNGVGVWFAADGAIGYNITAYNNSNADIYVSDFSNQTLENSIGLPNGISTISGTTTSNNISGGSASSYFVDADNANFQLIFTSTANNVGADLSLLYY